MRTCTLCGRPIVLVPSAQERARKAGGTPSDYTGLFTTHAVCAVQKREQETRKLIQRLRQNSPRAELPKPCEEGK